MCCVAKLHWAHTALCIGPTCCMTSCLDTVFQSYGKFIGFVVQSPATYIYLQHLQTHIPAAMPVTIYLHQARHYLDNRNHFCVVQACSLWITYLLMLPPVDVLASQLAAFLQCWKEQSHDGITILSSVAIKEIANLQVHIQRCCLSGELGTQHTAPCSTTHLQLPF